VGGWVSAVRRGCVTAVVGEEPPTGCQGGGGCTRSAVATQAARGSCRLRDRRTGAGLGNPAPFGPASVVWSLTLRLVHRFLSVRDAAAC
jgi:hypothetical protein